MRAAAIGFLAALLALAAAQSQGSAGADVSHPARALSAKDVRGAGGLRLREVGEFDSPTFVTSAPGARDLLFVVERGGRVVVLRDGGRPRTFLDIGERVSTSGERGLLSIAFAPDYERSRRFYVYYTAPGGEISVDEFRRSTDSATQALPDSRRSIVSLAHSGAFHNGGTVAFGPDRRLYIAPGENGTAAAAQDPDNPLGKLLEIDPERPGAVEIVATGLRNPFRFSFDRRTNTIAIADVGENQFEEVNYLKLGKARGANFGWAVFEGDSEYGGGYSLIGAPHSPPMHVYSHAGGRCSVTGGVTVRHRKLKPLDGRYVYADLCGGELRSFVPRPGANEARRDRALGLTVPRPVGFGTDARGRVYVASLEGSVYRIAD